MLVTAFGPFDGRQENASSLALAALKRLRPEIHTRVFPVDSVLAPARLRTALRTLRPRTLILLGEAAGSSEIRLEMKAWNELDFMIPDNAGRQPRGRLIEDDGPADYSATLPFVQLLPDLKVAGHPVRLSEDPGRYLCNQLFYTARHFIETRGLDCRAGFIHLPLAADYPTRESVRAVLEVMLRTSSPPTPGVRG